MQNVRNIFSHSSFHVLINTEKVLNSCSWCMTSFNFEFQFMKIIILAQNFTSLSWICPKNHGHIYDPEIALKEQLWMKNFQLILFFFCPRKQNKLEILFKTHQYVYAYFQIFFLQRYLIGEKVTCNISY